MFGDSALHLLPPRSMRRARLYVVLSSALGLAFCAPGGAQTPVGPGPQPPSADSSSSLPDAPLPQSADPAQASDKDPVTLRNTPIHILKDQAALWAGPVRIRPRDLEWLVPLTLATGASIATDHQAMSSVVSHDAVFNHANVVASDVLTGGFIAAPVALYAMGHLHQDAHSQEAGILSGEALLDGVVVEQGMKLIFWRERPSSDRAHGKFFETSVGVDSSFPSSHSLLAWSSAAVIAGEYPSRWVQFSVYTFATGVSLTRVLGQQHFPSDVLVGSAVGWLVGRYVYRKHHRASDDD